jgi:hypothetical protein
MKRVTISVSADGQVNISVEGRLSKKNAEDLKAIFALAVEIANGRRVKE